MLAEQVREIGCVQRLVDEHYCGFCASGVKKGIAGIPRDRAVVPVRARLGVIDPGERDMHAGRHLRVQFLHVGERILGAQVSFQIREHVARSGENRAGGRQGVQLTGFTGRPRGSYAWITRRRCSRAGDITVSAIPSGPVISYVAAPRRSCRRAGPAPGRAARSRDCCTQTEDEPRVRLDAGPSVRIRRTKRLRHFASYWGCRNDVSPGQGA